MVSYIRKRDGRIDEFTIEKIAKAINSSLEATNSQGDGLELAREVVRMLESKESNLPTVELVQDTVEEVLIARGFVRAAKAYILYRADRTKARSMRDDLMTTLEEITFGNSQPEFLAGNDTPMGMMLRYGQESSITYNRMFILSPDLNHALSNGLIYIHNLDFYSLTTNSSQIDLESVFKNGFSSGVVKLREPNSIGSCASLACVVIQSNQNDQYGPQVIADFDYAMAQGVAKSFKKRFKGNLEQTIAIRAIASEKAVIDQIDYDKIVPTIDNRNEYLDDLSKFLKENGLNRIANLLRNIHQYTVKTVEEDTYQAMESLIHNLNTMNTRIGAKVPQCCLNYGLDTSAEGRLVIKSILEVTQDGVGEGKTPAYPSQIMRVKEGVNYYPEDPNYDLLELALETTAKRGYPNYSFMDTAFNRDDQQEIAYGNYLRIYESYDNNNRVLKRGNISITSINLLNIALQAEGNLDEFKTLLGKTIDMVSKQLIQRLEYQGNREARSYPFLIQEDIWQGGSRLDGNGKIYDILRQGTLSIGYAGLNEALLYMTKKNHLDAKTQAIGLDIVDLMNKQIAFTAMHNQYNFNLIAPIDSQMLQAFSKHNLRLYGKIKGITDHQISIGFQLPFAADISNRQRAEIEAPYHRLTLGGHISQFSYQNLDDIKAGIKLMHDYQIGYGKFKKI